MTRSEFEKIVVEAVSSLPQEIRGRIENVEFRVVESPNRRQSRQFGADREGTLYGLYEGTPLTERSAEAPPLYPDRITIFKRAIEHDCKTRAAMVKCIQETVLHEIGHYFGFDDADLDQYGIG